MGIGAFLLSLGAKLLIGGKTLLGLAFRALEWLFEDWRRVLIACLAIALAGEMWTTRRIEADRDGWKAAAGEWQTAAHAWQAAHGKLLASVRAAQLAAAEADLANVERVTREYAAINERTADAYEARLDDTRAALGRVRAQFAGAAANDPGDGGRADVPPALTARCQAVGAADCDALLAALPGQLAAAEDNTSKLIALQDWVRSALLIDFSGGGQ